MKDTHVLCVACFIAYIAIIAVFIGHATDTLPKYTQRVISTSSDATTKTTQEAVPLGASEKKNCSCCAERTSAFSEKMDRYIQRKKDSRSEIAQKGD